MPPKKIFLSSRSKGQYELPIVIAWDLLVLSIGPDRAGTLSGPTISKRYDAGRLRFTEKRLAMLALASALTTKL